MFYFFNNLGALTFPGILDTLTNTAKTEDCPGVCVHAIATLICYEVLENVQCPQSMKCCIDQPINATEKAPEDSGEKTQSTADNRPMTTIYTTTTTVAPPPTTTSKPITNTKVNTTVMSAHETKDQSKKCPEVCVTESMADYCEAIITTQGICDPESSCCVSLNTAKNQPPANVLIPSKTKINYSTDKLHTKATTRPTPLASTVTVASTLADYTKATRKQCHGECVSEFLAPLLCNYLDSEAECADDGICCVLSAVGIVWIRYITQF